MKLRNLMMVGAALAAGLAAASALAQQQTPQVKSEQAERAEKKDAPMTTDGKTEAELRKEREEAARARKDTANARAAARKAKEGKELEEETIPPQ